MLYYNVRIKETLVKTVEIQAEDADEAVEIATDLYENGDIELDSSDCDDVEIEVVDRLRECDEPD